MSCSRYDNRRKCGSARNSQSTKETDGGVVSGDIRLVEFAAANNEQFHPATRRELPRTDLSGNGALRRI